MSRGLDFQALKQAALDRCPALLFELVPGGKIIGNEYQVVNPTRQDRHAGSFTINVKTGRWGEFATGDFGNDAISFYAYLHGLKQGEAAQELARMMGVLHE